ncbi:MAG: TonB-dependent receptor [Filimonas sp.]|nr:TonB-dependent receptor [Filimonas sp.]
MKRTMLILSLLLLSHVIFSQTFTLKGKVSDDSTSTGIADATVVAKGTSKGTKTNNDGSFVLQLPSQGKVTLVISYVGYKTETVTASPGTDISISLKKEAATLEEVVVIGYGTVKKKDLTGAVISVKGEEVSKVAAGNAMEALQGKLPGVDIVRTSGSAGATSNVTVRGNRSINAGNGPLYIVDGIQYENYQDINAGDIQSMEVLKDASSTAIYGSRGANGVILITTKKGTSGKVKVYANAYYGTSEVAGYPVPMDGASFTNLKRQAYRTNGKWNSPADDASIFTSTELAGIQNGTSTYWPGLLLHKGSQQDYNVGVSAGGEKTKVYFSFDYLKEKGLLKNDYSDRFTFRLNIDQSITNNFKVGLQSQLTYYKQNSRQDGVLTVANKIKPLYVPYNTDGSIVVSPGSDNQFNPLLDDVDGAYVNETKTTRILSTAYAEWKPVKGLTLRSNLGIVNSGGRNGFFESANTIDRLSSTGSIAKITNGRNTNVTWENIVTYQKSFGDHNLELTALTSYLSYQYDSSSAQGTGQLLPGQSFYALQNNPSNLAIWSNYVGRNLLSGAFRINYNYKGRYLLTLTGREDGSSVLASQNRWSFFPSVAAGWRIVDENFMSRQKIFTDLKLRASYGVAGNEAVKPYQTQSGLILIPTSWNDKSVLAYGLSSQTGNSNLKWELTGTMNIGLDFAILKNRISGSIDYYDSKTHDLLFLRTLPGTSGVTNTLQNIGKTRNTGIEIALHTVNVKTNSGFSWESAINYTRNREKIVDLVDGKSVIAGNTNSLIVGSPVNSFYDYEKIGIWQTKDADLAKLVGINSGIAAGYQPGDIRVKDQYNRNKISADSDRVVVGSAVPKYSIGFNNDFRYKNFDLNVYVYARVGQTFVSDYANKFEPNAIENGANVNFWTPENATNDYPRPNSSLSRAALPFATTLGYEDGSFVKIRNITLGYTLPQSVLKSMHMTSLRIYASAKNYITFSKVKDYDPEGGGSFERPLTKMIVAGLNITF